MPIRVIKCGSPLAAVDLLDSAIGRFPLLPELRYWRGNALRLSGSREAAESDFRHVLDDVPYHRNAALSLAYMLREQGRLCAAADVIMRSWYERNGTSEEMVGDLGFLREFGAHLRAYELTRAALERWPENSDIAALCAEFALAIGEFSIARRCLHAALDRDPRKSRGELNWIDGVYKQLVEQRKLHDAGSLASAAALGVCADAQG